VIAPRLPAARLLIPLAILLLPALLISPAAGRGAGAQTPAGTLNWQACGGGFECATLSVPLDYDSPQGRRIDVALIRMRARDAANRIGPLLVNPGGPGGSGIDFLRRWAPTLSREIRDRFDLVAFDPRGVGQSTPLSCHDTIQELMALPASPDSAEEWREVQDKTRAFAETCAQRGRDLLPHLGTVDAVRDMDEIRKALGEQKISFFGYSYGTILGAVYADLFPGGLRALVLDGAADISTSGEELLRHQALAFEAALEHYLEFCRVRRCLGSDDPKKTILQLLDRAAATPIPAPQADRPAGDGELTYALLAALYSDAVWGELTLALNAASNGNASAVIRLADRIVGRRSDGSYDNSSEMNAAVNCLDNDFGRDPARHIALAVELDARAPVFGAFVGAGGLGCAFWQAEPRPLRTPRAAGAPPILVIGTTGDPATPYIWAEAVAKQLESAVLLTFNGEGHTAYRRGDGCIDDFVNIYLLTLRLPVPASACGNPALSRPLQIAVDTPTPAPSPTAVPTAPTPSATATAGPLAGPPARDGDAGSPLLLIGAIIAAVAGVAGVIVAARLR
jgi:pimeloyl-ACP methyl ester carboxylesterase